MKRKQPHTRNELSPQFLAAAHKSRPANLLPALLRMTEEVRQDILLPASKRLDQIVIETKENKGMVTSGAKAVLTETDRQCEDAMEKKLRAAFPDAFILGEEKFGAASKSEKNAFLTEALTTGKIVFLVDALDGTCDFTQGGDGFGVMVTALKGNQVIAAVVHRCVDYAHPEDLGHTLTFETGDVVRYDGVALKPLSDRTFKTDPHQMRGYAAVDFVRAMKTPEKAAGFPDLSKSFDSISDLWTCSKMYTDLLTGQHQFMLVSPPVDIFDYPAGIALIEKSGGVAKFLDGTAASLPEIVRRQSFGLEDGDGSYKDVRNTLVLAVSEDVFKVVQSNVLGALQKKQNPAPK